MSEWKTIETAPKDGTYFIAAAIARKSSKNTNNGWLVSVAKYGVRYGKGKFLFISSVALPEPLYWMPMPEPPK